MSGGLYLPVGAARLLQEAEKAASFDSRQIGQSDDSRNLDRLEGVLISENIPVVVVPEAVYRCAYIVYKSVIQAT